jgi:septal ring factor EnvC (AmiA/AmiB activator)
MAVGRVFGYIPVISSFATQNLLAALNARRFMFYFVQRCAIDDYIPMMDQINPDDLGSKLAASDAACVQAQAQTDQLRRELRQCSWTQSYLKAVASQYEAELKMTRAELRDVHESATRMNAEIHDQNGQIADLHGQISALRNSLSWRMTRPLRSLSRRLSRLRKHSLE